MSMMLPQMVSCPACGHLFDMQAAESVNADRRPDLRQSVLDARFQVEPCPQCAEEFRLDSRLNYIDIGRGQWISVQPLGEMENWVLMEDEAEVVFHKAYGKAASPLARAIGEALTVRLVFGWAALREKLVAAEHEIDDVVLELAKLAVIGGIGGAPLKAGTELRLERVEGDDLYMTWIDAQTEREIEPLMVPRAVYETVASATEAWAPIRAQLTGGPFVDIQKLFIGEGRSAA